MHPVFERLRKRKVVSWAVAYTAAAGVLYSILEGPAEPWGITDAMLRAAQVVLVGGLLVTLVLAWYHGEQGRQTVSTSELLMIGSLFALVALGIRLVWTPTAASDPRSPSSNWAVALGLPSAPEPGAPAAGDHAHPFDISRDGRLIVYRGGGVGGDAQLWLREQGSLDPISLLGTERGDTPSLSPDGSEVLFWRREAGLLRMPVRGGPPAVLAPDAYRQGSTWGADGFVYYAASDSTIRRVPVGGGDPEAFTAKEAAFVHRWPHALPGDGAILLTVTQQPTEGLPAQMEAAADSTFVGWASGEDRVPVRLFPGTNARFVDSGHILYMTVDGVLTGVSFDPRTGEAGSSHVPLRDDVWFSNGGLLGRYAISGLGDLLFWERSEEPAGWNDQVVWVDRGTGVVTPIDETWNVEAVTTWSSLELSPDGTHLAYSVFVDGTSRQRVRRLSDGTDWAIDPGTSGDRRAHWLHDGVGMTFVRAHYDPIGWWVVRAKADGSGEPETLLVASDVDLVAITEAELTPDGEWVIVRAGSSESGGVTSGTDTDVYAINLSDRRKINIAATPSQEWTPDLSPDGRWIAFTTNTDYVERVVVRPFPNVDDGLYVVSLGAGRQPRWSPEGDELFYLDDQDRMVAATVTLEPTFNVTGRETLFSATDLMVHNNGWAMYDYDPVGRRFVMFREGPEQLPTDRVLLVAGFLDQVREAIPR